MMKTVVKIEIYVSEEAPEFDQQFIRKWSQSKNKILNEFENSSRIFFVMMKTVVEIERYVFEEAPEFDQQFIRK